MKSCFYHVFILFYFGFLTSINSLIRVSFDKVLLYKLSNLRDIYESANVPNDSRANAAEGVPYNKIIGDTDFILNGIVQKPKGNMTIDAFVRAGPRKYTHFDPKNVVAAIVTCGGLCPGLNNVVREVVHSLYYLYGIDSVIGIR